MHVTKGMSRSLHPFNVTGHPAITINAGFVDGLPCGIMVVGKMFDEVIVLQVARHIENVSKRTLL